MTISIQYWSYFRDLTGTSADKIEVPDGTTVAGMLDALHLRHPRLRPLRASTLVAVGVEYAEAQRVLRANEEVALFPPVQGG